MSDEVILEAVREIEQGLVEADLGGNIYKKRIGIKGRGKRGGVRTILAYSKQGRTFFLYGFEKADRANVTLKEKEQLKILGNYYLDCSDKDLEAMLSSKEMIEYQEV